MDLLDFLAPDQVPPGFDAPSRPQPLTSGGMPPGPQRLSARELRRVVTLTAPGGAPQYAPVREVNRYPSGIQTATNTVAAGASALVINDTPTSRIWLTVRNRADSLGVLYLAIGQAASNTSAAFELAAGGALLFDFAVPQDEIYVGASAAGVVNYVVTWCDSPLL